MGWFGTGALDGDDGMDLQVEIFHLLDLDTHPDMEIYHSNYENHIKTTLENNQDKIYDWLRDYDWTERYNPGFIQEVYIQGTAQIMLDYNVKISERGKPVMIDFAKRDKWAEKDTERKASMDKLIKDLENN